MVAEAEAAVGVLLPAREDVGSVQLPASGLIPDVALEKTAIRH